MSGIDNICLGMATRMNNKPTNGKYFVKEFWPECTMNIQFVKFHVKECRTECVMNIKRIYTKNEICLNTRLNVKRMSNSKYICCKSHILYPLSSHSVILGLCLCQSMFQSLLRYTNYHNVKCIMNV